MTRKTSETMRRGEAHRAVASAPWRRHTWPLVLCGSLASCAGHRDAAQTSSDGSRSSGANGSASTPDTSAWSLAIVPLRLRMADSGHPVHVAELHGDGTLTFDGELRARIDGHRMVTPAGQPIFEMSRDGSAMFCLVQPTRSR